MNSYNVPQNRCHMAELSIEEGIRRFVSEEVTMRVNVDAIIADVEALEKKLVTKPKVPIRQRIKQLVRLGCSQNRVIEVLRSEMIEVRRRFSQEKDVKGKVLDECPGKGKRKKRECGPLKFPLTTSQVATRFGVSKDTVRRTLNDLCIEPPKTRGGHFRINREIFNQLKRKFDGSARYQ